VVPTFEKGEGGRDGSHFINRASRWCDVSPSFLPPCFLVSNKLNMNSFH
jgi:hypothetical protein